MNTLMILLVSGSPRPTSQAVPRPSSKLVAEHRAEQTAFHKGTWTPVKFLNGMQTGMHVWQAQPAQVRKAEHLDIFCMNGDVGDAYLHHDCPDVPARADCYRRSIMLSKLPTLPKRTSRQSGAELDLFPQSSAICEQPLLL